MAASTSSFPASERTGMGSLPQEVLVRILKVAHVSNLSWFSFEDNDLLPLRRVSRSFREAVDIAIEDFVCRITPAKDSEAAVLARVDFCLQNVLRRWQNLREIRLQFDLEADSLLSVLHAIAASCPQLQTLRLRVCPLTRGHKEVYRAGSAPCFTALAQLKNLEVLDIESFVCYSDWDLGLSSLTGLKSLSMERGAIGRLEPVRGLTSLRLQNFTPQEGDARGHDMSGLRESSRLRSLSLNYMSLESLSVPSSLQHLELDDVDLASRIDDGGGLPDLESLKLLAVDVRSLPSVSSCTKLTSISLVGVKHLSMLPDLSRLVNLRQLDFQVLDLQKVPVWGSLGNLSALHISSCAMRSLPDVGTLHRLKSLRLESLSRLSAVPGLENLQSLTDLFVRGCPVLDVSLAVSSLTSLQSLHLSGGVAGHSLPTLSSLVRLHELHISCHRRVGALPHVGNLSRLRSLSICEMPHLQVAPCLNGLRSLQTLTITKCPLLKACAIPPGLVNLRTFCLGEMTISFHH